MIWFTISGQPPTATAQQKGLSRNGTWYKPQHLKEAEAFYMHAVKKYRPAVPLEGPIELRVEFYFRSSKTKGHRAGDPKTSRPDTDNMVKLLKDCLTRSGFWKDDALVAKEIVYKGYNDLPGINITIIPWEERQ